MSKKKFKDFSYPDQKDNEFQSKIYKKREYYFNRVPQRDIIKTYDEIKTYRADNCKADIEPKEQQYIIPNLINPNTPYKGLLLMHGVGVGKTMTAIRVAEQFKEQIKKYNTKIFVVVPGPNTKENFKKELIGITGDTYLKNKEELKQMSKAEIERETKAALYSALQYYKIMSYKTFYKKVLGEKIIDRKINTNNDNIAKHSNNKKYKKSDEGEYEREIVVDKISNMDNTLLIIDEAHNLSDNEYGNALRHIIKKSTNLRVLLLTATPMINLADEIVDLLNFIRPENDQIERDKIFSSEKNYKMTIKEDGLEYLRKMAQGYVSFYRGAIPYTFADRIDKGDIPKSLLFTPVIKCTMNDFQKKAYLKAIKNQDISTDNNEMVDDKRDGKIVDGKKGDVKKGDPLQKSTIAAGNFVFPVLDNDGKDIIGTYSTEGVSLLLSQLNNNGKKLKQMINKKLFNNKLDKYDEDNFIIEKEKKHISGIILREEYLSSFSIKFYKILLELNKLNEKNKNNGTSFIYSNLVNAGGIELFAETLIMNGYLEYLEDGKYDIEDDTRDYKTGLSFKEYKKKYKDDLNNFKPATFILITGGNEESGEDIPEIKQKIIREVFNSANNIDGKHIKFLLGSRVMNEGVTLKNVKYVHIIDTFYNIPKAEQVIGRAIRMCVHKDVINDTNRFPSVSIYRYVASSNNNFSMDELLYQKAELKYLTVKKIESVLKETAVDCPLLLHANSFPEEIIKYNKCSYPTRENINAGKLICPALCDFKTCDLKCNKINDSYWDSKKKSYKLLSKNDIDYNTFNINLAKDEIILIKNKIKDLYKFNHIYQYDDILYKINKSFLDHQMDLFNEYFLEQALEDMMPKSEYDFNKFNDIIYDKYNRPGYIIMRDKYYIFQPFNENENIAMYYRQNVKIDQPNYISLDNYIKQNYKKNFSSKIVNLDTNKKIVQSYDYESTLEYYENRDENFIVGIIDKNVNKLVSTDIDLFKIRPSKNKITSKKRGTGIPTFKGSVCYNSKEKSELIKILEKMPNMSSKLLTNMKKLTRENICNELKNKLLFLEKYSTSKDKNKITYIIIPANHPVYPFPYNLEDRIKSITKFVIKLSNDHKFDITVKNIKNGTFLDKTDKDLAKYELSFNNNKYFVNKEKELENQGFKLIKNIWSLIID
jgi:hypothetical protein